MKIKFFITLIAFILAVLLTSWKNQVFFHFEITLQSSVEGRAQLFYDIGDGFREKNSAIQITKSGKPTVYQFPIPTGDYHVLRFDPLDREGTITFSQARIVDSNGNIIKTFSPQQFVPQQQIKSLTTEEDSGQLTTIVDANDPILILSREPFSLKVNRIALYTKIGLVFFINFLAGLALTLLLYIIYLWIIQPLLWYLTVLSNKPIDALLLRINRPSYIIFDRLALRFYSLLIIFFLIMSVIGFHGSSLSYHSNYSYVTHKVKPILGTPKGIRSDEWNYQTPSILYQLWRKDTLSVEDSALGVQKAALLGNIPVWHFTQIFRPQFWAFFILPVEKAFSVYWQFKTLLLLSGVFTLLLLLTGSSFISIFGTLWYYFSAYTQWSFSWPSLLPEMVGLFCLTVCSACYLLVANRTWIAILVAIFCASCAINFALCAYPPHQIPFIWIGIFIVVWWIITKWQTIIDKEYLKVHIVAVTTCLGIIILTMGAFFYDAKDTLEIVAHTIYPGQRSLPGGALSISKLFSHFMDLWKTESYFPSTLFNICEGTGFYWLAPITLLVAIQKPRSLVQLFKYVSFYLWIPFFLLLGWIILPIPAEIGNYLFLNKVIGTRPLAALGLLNIAIITVFLSQVTRPLLDKEISLSDIISHIVQVLGIFLLIFIWLVQTNQSFNNFWAWHEILITSLYIAILIQLIVHKLIHLLIPVLLVPLIVVNAPINPLDRGLKVIKHSELWQVLHHDKSKTFTTGKWLVFSEGFTPAAYFTAHGLDVFNSTFKYVPDLAAMSKLDPTGTYKNVYNNSSYLIVRPLLDKDTVQFQQMGNPALVKIQISPLNPVLKKLGIKYLAFEHPIATVDTTKLKTLGTIAGFQIVELL